MLTTLLIADAVEKGGPGSGPHPVGRSISQSKLAENAHKATVTADRATHEAHDAESHSRAADAHEKASAANALGAKTSVTPQLYQAHVAYHDKMAASHRASAGN
jgi:hypothetical protein